MNVTPIRESVPRVTQFDERGVPCEAEIPSRSRPHITYKMLRTGGRWIHKVQPCEAAQFGNECHHKIALERITKEDYMTTDTVEDEVVGRELAVSETVSLPVPVSVAIEQWNEYQELTRKLLNETDYQKIGNKQFKKKSAWRKYARAFNITDRVAYEHVERAPDGFPLWARVRVQAEAQNGRTAEADHECHIGERCCPRAQSVAAFCIKSDWQNHTCCDVGCNGRMHWSHPGDLPATALTRAKNRAISDLIGAGEVSAEEMTEESARRDEPQGSGLRASAPPRDRSARMPPPPAAPRHPPAGTVAPECPAGHGVAAFVKAGVSKAGREYGAFWGCRDRGCTAGFKGKAWSINADAWEDELSQKAQLASAPGKRDDPDALPFED